VARFFSAFPALDCIIRNMFQTGGQLAVQSPACIPDEFTLLIKPEMRKKACKVACRSADGIGVRFV
jgi:hypothetical protein